MFDRIKIGQIITSHLKTLRSINRPESSIRAKDVITFFLIPAILSGILTYKQIHLDSQVANLIAIISIFGGFLFNLLAIIYGYLKDIKADNPSKIKLRFAGEINANISFCILLSVFNIIALLVYSMWPIRVNICLAYYTKTFLLALIYFLLLCFFLTLLMVLSRVFILLQKDGSS